jgi:hypothetical protein
MIQPRDVLLLEVHRIIADVAADTVAKLGSRPPDFPGDPLEQNGNMAALLAGVREIATSYVSYPPQEADSRALAPEESSAIAAFNLSDAERSALTKLVADACASALLRLFCLMDGVADPELTHTPRWTGVPFANTDRSAMLHDDFFESYWAYRDRIENAR